MGLRATGRQVLRDGAVIAVAMGVMNVTTYGFIILAARLLGPAEYGALAAVMGVLLVVNVLSLGLQATGARRVVGGPESRAEIEREMLSTSYASALALGLLVLAATPVISLDAEPRLVGGGRADRCDRGAVDGDGRAGRHPAGRASLGPVGRHLPRRGAGPHRVRDARAARRAQHPRRDGGRDARCAGARPGRLARAASTGPARRRARRLHRARAALGARRRAARDLPQLARPAGLLRAVQRRRDRRPEHARRAPGRAVRRVG